MKDNRVDVLIVGAGPTGMLMAAEVARYGLSCRIIDKGVACQDQSRAVAIQARTMEIFEHLGFAEAFLAEGLRLKVGNPICSFHKLGRISFDTLDSSYPFILSLEQVKTEEILEQYLISFGVKIERGVEFLRMKQREEDVEVVVAHTTSGQEETIQATWVVGCDGAHSQVRKQLNLAFEGKPLLGIFSLADVRIHWDYPIDELFVFLDAIGALAAIPLPEPKRYRLIFQLERCRNLLKERHSLPNGQLKEQIVAKPQLKEVQELLCKHTGSYVLVSDPLWCANFCINSRMVETYQKGSVFLAGDAAHIHSPVGGQGMNTGLQDAFNLAWKLALVHNKQAGKKLLDTYDLERRSVAKKLLQATEIASQIATLQNRVAIALRNAAIFCLTRISFCRDIW
ncbi:MAG: FAD-dependent monooxygenase [Rhabdochlamydiaceae bacterium]|jgi:2-polyprenyl-6-methoxyphenol hydroxylase-like FAD-dependent oxidoreductase